VSPAGRGFLVDAIPTSGLFKRTWTQNSKVTFSDRHSNGSVMQAKGPRCKCHAYILDCLGLPSDHNEADLG